MQIYILSSFFFLVRPRPSRAGARRPSPALPSRRTAAKRRRALKMTPTQSEDRGEFHTVSTFSHAYTHTCLPRAAGCIQRV